MSLQIYESIASSDEHSHRLFQHALCADICIRRQITNQTKVDTNERYFVENSVYIKRQNFNKGDNSRNFFLHSHDFR